MKQERGTGIHRKNTFSFLKVGSEYEKGINGLIEHQRVFTPIPGGVSLADAGIKSDVTIISPGTGTGLQGAAGALYYATTAGVDDMDFIVSTNYGIINHTVPTTIYEAAGAGGVVYNTGGGVLNMASGMFGVIFNLTDSEYGTMAGLKSNLVILPGTTMTADTYSGVRLENSNGGTSAIDNAYGVWIEDFSLGTLGNTGVRIGDITGGSVNNYGVYIRSVTGTSTQNYGLLIGNVSGGTAQNYAISTQAGEVSFGDRVLCSASTTSRASLNIAHGTAPSAPQNGDIWTTTTSMYARINGSTVDLGAGGGGGASAIDDLSDAVSDVSSVYLGSGSGTSDDGNNFNAAVGINAMNSNTSGTQNTAIGYQALYSNATQSSNTALGHEALYASTAGYSNTAVGLGSSRNRASGAANTTVGAGSGSSTAGSGSYNTLVGTNAGYNVSTGSYNTAFGASSLVSVTTGNNNIAIGFEAGYYTESSHNVFIGHQAGKGVSGTVPAANNTAVGYQALLDITSGNFNTVLGSQAGANITTGNSNTYLGHQAGINTTTGISNTYVGSGAGQNATGDNNVIIGMTAGQGSVGAGYLYTVAIGSFALQSLTDGDSNIAIGFQSAYSVTTGENNIIIGRQAGIVLTTQTENVMIGTFAGQYTAAGSNVYIGSNVGRGASGTNTAGSNVAVGYEVLSVITTGSYNTAIGYHSMVSCLGGTNNVAAGHNAGHDLTIGGSNVIVGHDAAYSLLSGNGNVVIGKNAGYENTASSYNVYVGSYAGRYQTGQYNVFLGDQAGMGVTATSDADRNVGLGYQAGFSLTTGLQNTIIGYQAGYDITTGASNVIVGVGAGGELTTGNDNVLLGSNAGHGVSTTSNFGRAIAIGAGALLNLTTGTSNTGIGFQSLFNTADGTHNVAIGYNTIHTNISGDYNIAIGSQALYTATGDLSIAIGRNSMYSLTTGLRNTAVGHDSMVYSTTGQDNCAFGYEAMRYATAGSQNVFIGSQSGKGDIGGTSTGSANIGIGHNALTKYTTAGYNIAIGFSPLINLETGSNNIAIGHNALLSADASSGNISIGATTSDALTAGSYNTVVGYNAGTDMVTESNNTFLGAWAGSTTTGSSNVFIGYYAGANETGDNKLYIANSNTATPLIHGDFSTGMVTINDDLTVEGEIYGGNATTESLVLIDNAVDLNRINLDTTPAPNDPAFYPDTTDSINLGALANVWAAFYSKQISDTGSSVGIGTQVPYAKLDVNGDARVIASNYLILGGTAGAVSNRAKINAPASDVIEIFGSTSSTRNITVELTSNDTTAASASELWFNRYDRVVSGDYLGVLQFRGHDDRDDEYTGIQIIASGRSTWASPNLDSQLDIQVHNGTSMASRLKIDGDQIAITGDTTVEGDFTLLETYWEDVRVPLSATNRGSANAPDFAKFMDDGGGTPSQGVYTYLFNKNTEEEVYFEMQIPHAYKEGTDIEMHVHWSPMDTDTGTVRWGLEYTVANVDGTFGNTTLIYVNDAADGTAKKHQVASFSGISGTGLTISCMLICRLFRDAGDAADTYDEDAALHEIDAHIEVNTIGSRDEWTK